jgi:4-amino-4-deoxy-L-arabinose transferase-like glycosyltransferase
MKGPRQNLVVLILVTLVLRIIWAASLETGQDEAYHFLYTVHPDWSYFDHPPMLMYVAKFGLAVFGGWIHPLSVRIGFILLFAGSTWIMYRWTADWFGESAGFYAALALNLSRSSSTENRTPSTASTRSVGLGWIGLRWSDA